MPTVTSEFSHSSRYVSAYSLPRVLLYRRFTSAFKGLDSEGLHALRFYDGILILSDSQLELLAMRLGIRASNHARIKSAFRKQHRNRWRSYLATADLDPAPPCAWNMLLRRRYGQTVDLTNRCRIVRMIPRRISAMDFTLIQKHLYFLRSLAPQHFDDGQHEESLPVGVNRSSLGNSPLHRMAHQNFRRRNGVFFQPSTAEVHISRTGVIACLPIVLVDHGGRSESSEESCQPIRICLVSWNS